MWPFIRPIRLIRYLFIWRVNQSLVRLPSYLPTELSLVLGTAITRRLPTRQAAPWIKAMAPWEELGGLSIINRPERKKPSFPPDAAWPVKTTVFAYPGKLTYGRGEPILWELKLLGDDADHDLFLEVILPAIEDIATTKLPATRRHNLLWGGFDIQAIYVARGRRWEPLVQVGHLDLRCRVTPTQWAEGWDTDFIAQSVSESDLNFNRLRWLTPVILEDAASPPSRRRRGRRRRKNPPPPELSNILKALLERMITLLPGKHNTPDTLWEAVGPEERAAFESALDQAGGVSLLKAAMKSAPKRWPTGQIGTEFFFPSIPTSLLPYLDLASVLHIGKQTHFGCGTFVLLPAKR